MVDSLCARLSNLLRVPVTPKRMDCEPRLFYDETRGQYDSTRILDHIRGHDSPEVLRGDKFITLFDGDLYIPILTFVFGEAQLNGSAAIVSYHRLQNERYGLTADPLLLMERTCKEILHELGHTVGLLHCLLPHCVMHASNDVSGVDVKREQYCRECHAVVAGYFIGPLAIMR
jgi:archaemetzincin